jgi:hypothetical protein
MCRQQSRQLFLASLSSGNSQRFQFQLAQFAMTGGNSGNGTRPISNWDPQLRQFNDTIVCTGNSNCNPAIAPIGVRAAPPCIMNQKLEMGPKSETWTRKLTQVEQLHRAMLLVALSRPVMAGFPSIQGMASTLRFRTIQAVPRICG